MYLQKWIRSSHLLQNEMDLEVITLSELSQTEEEKTVWFHLNVESKNKNKKMNKQWNRNIIIDAENKQEVARGKKNGERAISAVAQSCPNLCDLIDCSTPGLPVHHQLPEFTQTHVHWVGDAIPSSHPLSSPSPPTFNLSQHKGFFFFPLSQLFASGGQSIGVSVLASFLPKKSQGWSPSEWTGWISLQSKGLSRVFSNTTVQKHQFFSIQLSL